MAMATLCLTPVPWVSLSQVRKGHRRFALGEQDSPVEVEQQTAPQTDPVEVVAGGCKTCGRSEVMWGCNGLGRIQGGIAAVPGFTWWPIKAFRPCPAFVESGGRYKRQGQRLEEFAYGRRIDYTESSTTSAGKSGAKTKNTRKRSK